MGDGNLKWENGIWIMEFKIGKWNMDNGNIKWKNGIWMIGI